MSSFFRDRIQYALLHESYYIEHELSEKLNELFADKAKVWVECDIEGVNIRVNRKNISKEDFNHKIKHVMGASPFEVLNPTHLYQNTCYRFSWEDIFRLK